MSANPVTAGPPAAQVSTSDADIQAGTGDLNSYPLQTRSESANINTVLIQFAGASGEYSNYDVVNLRIESGAGPDPSNQVPTSGLKQWLRADPACTVLTPFPSL